MGKGILQQLGLATLTAARRRTAHRGEDVDQVARLAPGVAHDEMPEQPCLQRVALATPQGLQMAYLVFFLSPDLLCGGLTPALGQFPAVQFGILELPPTDVVVLALAVAAALHEGRPWCSLTVSLGQRLTAQTVDGMVQLHNPGLLTLKVAVGLQIVEHRRHKGGPVAAPAHLSAVTGQIAIARLGIALHDEHPEHLALPNLCPKNGGRPGIGDALRGAEDAVKRAQSSLATCPECGTKAAAGTRFCPECGKPMTQPATDACPKCGAQTNGAKFCPECGTKIERAASTVCPNCGTDGKGAKFCPECGTKILG